MTCDSFPLPRAVLFDWDGTLADNWGAISAAVNAARATFGLETWSEEETYRQCTRALRDSFPEWFGQDWERARAIFYEHFTHAHLDALRPIPGAASLLDRLKAACIPLFIVSNKQGELLRQETERLGWSERFEGIVGAGDTPLAKPSRDPVDYALSQGGLNADNLAFWFVGDTDVDVACARASGCTPVLVRATEDVRHTLGVPLAFADLSSLEAFLQDHGLAPSCKV